MKMGVITLNGYVGRLKEGDWVTRVNVLLDDMIPKNPKKKPKWRGQDLPRGFDFDRLKARWALLGRGGASRLKQLIDKEAEFPETVAGADNILKAVSLRALLLEIRLLYLATGCQRFCSDMSQSTHWLRSLCSGRVACHFTGVSKPQQKTHRPDFRGTFILLF